MALQLKNNKKKFFGLCYRYFCFCFGSQKISPKKLEIILKLENALKKGLQVKEKTKNIF